MFLKYLGFDLGREYSLKNYVIPIFFFDNVSYTYTLILRYTAKSFATSSTP